MIVITDIDHTISDAAWRDPLVGRWDEYYAASVDDKPIEFVVNFLRLLSANRRSIFAITGRPEHTRMMTMKWLMRHEVPIDWVFMRDDGDYRPAREVKVSLVKENFDLSLIEFVLEDRADSVAAYRGLGLNVLQINYGGSHGKAASEDHGSQEAGQRG
jgi:uncharacterized HAD superfamily protein